MSTFYEASWTFHYPDMLSIRRLPGIVTHTQYVIALGCMDDSNDSFLDDIEILDWHENKQWKKVSLKLPLPMWFFTPCVYNDQLTIVCFHKERYWYNEPFEVPFSAVIESADQPTDASD